MTLLGSQGFSFDLEEGVYSGYTISYVALQLAVYMGFKEIVFLGLDLKHRDSDTHFFGQDFHSRRHEETEFPRMARMLSHGVRLLKEKKVTVYNCSPVCTLDCFVRISYDYAISL